MSLKPPAVGPFRKASVRSIIENHFCRTHARSVHGVTLQLSGGGGSREAVSLFPSVHSGVPGASVAAILIREENSDGLTCSWEPFMFSPAESVEGVSKEHEPGSFF